MHTRLAAALILLLSVAAPVSAQQRPLVTEDPETIGLGLVLIEAGIDYQHSIFYPASGLEGNLIRLPTMGVSFGISSIAELQIDGGLYNRLGVTSRQAAPLSRVLDFTGDATSDVEDITIATKIRVAAEKPGMFYATAARDTMVAKDAVVGYTTDYLGRKTGDIKAPVAGLITFIRGVPSMWTGATLVNVSPVLTTLPPYKKTG